jgi:hypothetical protein
MAGPSFKDVLSGMVSDLGAESEAKAQAEANAAEAKAKAEAESDRIRRRKRTLDEDADIAESLSEIPPYELAFLRAEQGRHIRRAQQAAENAILLTAYHHKQSDRPHKFQFYGEQLMCCSRCSPGIAKDWEEMSRTVIEKHGRQKLS